MPLRKVSSSLSECLWLFAFESCAGCSRRRSLYFIFAFAEGLLRIGGRECKFGFKSRLGGAAFDSIHGMFYY